jgi:hypothetical protein
MFTPKGRETATRAPRNAGKRNHGVRIAVRDTYPTPNASAAPRPEWAQDARHGLPRVTPRHRGRL